MKLLSNRVIKAAELEVLDSASELGISPTFLPGQDSYAQVAAAAEPTDQSSALEDELEEIRKIAHEEADAIREQAKTEAAALLSEAEARAMEIREEHSKRGYQEGFAKGKDQGYHDGLVQGRAEAEEEVRRKWTSLLQQLTDTISTAVTVRDLALERSEEDILKLSLAVAEKIIKREIAVDISSSLGIVKSALERVNGGRNVTVRVHPDIARAIEESRGWVASIKGIDKIEIIEDPSVELGGCLIESEFGRIDGRLETRIEEIASALMEVCNHVRK